MKTTFLCKSLCLFAIALLVPLLTLSQTTSATATGLISDESGAVIPGATVTITAVDTGVSLTTETNDDGIYRIAGLVPGAYRIGVTKEGFRALSQQGIDLHTGETASLNYTLPVGSLQQTVSVEGSSINLETASSTVGQTIESTQIEDTPLNGRNVFNLLALAPGVVPQGATSGSPLNNQAAIGNFTNPAGWGNYQIGGGAAGQNAQFLDGAPMGTPIQNWLIVVPSEDSIQEFRVDSNNLNSEYGRFYGGVINFATKSGTNALHGNVYEYFRNTVLDANNTFNKKANIAVPPLEQNQYGVSLGGPIKQDKLFFFGNWEGYANRSGLPYAARVPTAPELNGDFTADKPIYLNGTSPQVQVSCNGVLNKVCLDPTANYLNNTIKYWGVPNIPNVPEGGINFQTNASSGSNANQVTLRGDYNLTHHQIFARYTWWGTNTLATNYFHNNVPQPLIKSTTNQAVIGDTYTITPTTVADVRFSYSLFDYVSYPPDIGKVDLTQFPGLAPFANQVTFKVLPVISLPGYSPSSFPYTIINVINFIPFQTYHVNANISKSVGKHSIKFGGEWQKIEASFLKPPQNPTGSFTFTTGAGSTTTNQFANYDLGNAIPISSSIGTGQRLRLTEPYGGIYVTDTYAATPKLTVHGGIRWDIPGSFAEKNNFNTVLEPNVASPLGTIANPATGTTQALKGNLVLVASSQYPSRNDNSFHSHLFAPNAGLTYRLFPHTVVRTGYSLTYSAYDTGTPSPLGSPINALTTPATGPLSNPFPQLNGVLPQPVGRSASYSNLIQGLAISGRYPVVPFPYAQQWNFNIEQELGSDSVLDVGYVGSEGTHQPLTRNLNALSDALAAQAATQYQGLVTGGLSGSAADAQTFVNVQLANPLAGKLASGSAYNGATVAQGQLLRPFPQFGNVSDSSWNEGASIYHSLQVSYRKRFKSSGTIFVSYGWSKLIGTIDTNTGFLESTSVGGYQDPNNLAADRSLESFDVPQRLVLNYSLTLPFGKGKRWLGNANPVVDRLVSGWNASSITTFQNGFPLVLTAQANDLSNKFGFGPIRPTVVAGCSKKISGSADSRLSEWFNTACFLQPSTPFSIGNQGRTDSTLRTQGINNWDFALSKATAINERFNLLFTAQFLNMFNHVQYGQPGAQVGSSLFGKITSQINNPRQIQFGLRLSF